MTTEGMPGILKYIIVEDDNSDELKKKLSDLDVYVGEEGDRDRRWLRCLCLPSRGLSSLTLRIKMQWR